MPATLHAVSCAACGALIEFEARTVPAKLPCPSCGSAKTKKAKPAAYAPAVETVRAHA